MEFKVEDFQQVITDLSTENANLRLAVTVLQRTVQELEAEKGEKKGDKKDG